MLPESEEKTCWFGTWSLEGDKELVYSIQVMAHPEELVEWVCSCIAQLSVSRCLTEHICPLEAELSHKPVSA